MLKNDPNAEDTFHLERGRYETLFSVKYGEL